MKPIKTAAHELPRKLPVWKLQQRAKTLRQVAQEQIANNREVVMNILDYDDLQHNTHLYDCGCEFLSRLEDESVRQSLLRSKTFWNWYRNEWSMVQDSFIKLVMQLHSFSTQSIRAMYQREMQHFCVRSEAVAQSFITFLSCQNIR